MDGKREPEVVRAGQGVQVTDVARFLAAVRPAADRDGGAGLVD
ncbi:MAG: hypothetical protein JWM13_1930, partial [Arthrobacter sp.]|nr:hypothetical protein [Arthrobacter sp.]